MTCACLVDTTRCIGCSACIDECPWQAPAIDYWDVDTPHIRKCTFCFERQQTRIDRVRINGKLLRGAAQEKLLAEARRRIAAAPEKYVDHIYGEKELGGLGRLYLAGVPFEKLGFPTRFAPRAESKGMGATDRSRGAWASLGTRIGTVLAGLCWWFHRRDEVRGTGAVRRVNRRREAAGSAGRARTPAAAAPRESAPAGTIPAATAPPPDGNPVGPKWAATAS